MEDKRRRGKAEERRSRGEEEEERSKEAAEERSSVGLALPHSAGCSVCKTSHSVH